MYNLDTIENNDSVEQEFIINRAAKAVYWAFSIIYGLGLLYIAYIIASHSKMSFSETLFINLFAVALFFLIAGFQYYLHYLEGLDVTVNQEGLWYTKLGKEKSFLRWDEVKKVQAKSLNTGIKLCDSSGRVRINLRLELMYYPLLREIVARKTKIM